MSGPTKLVSNRHLKWHTSLVSHAEAKALPQPNPPPCQLWLFRNDHDQAIRTLVEFELPGSEATTSHDGDRPVIEPAHKKGLAALLDSWKPLDEEFPEIGDPTPAPKNIF